VQHLLHWLSALWLLAFGDIGFTTPFPALLYVLGLSKESMQ
jgi:hypothetical protein